MTIRRLHAGAAALAVVSLPVFGPTEARGAARTNVAAIEQLRFGAEMAQAGNWREAIYRWKKALESDPDNPRLHNNLAVGYETIGEWELAGEEYKKALALGSSSKEIRENYALFQNFYDQVKKRRAEARVRGGSAPEGSAPEGSAPEGPAPEGPAPSDPAPESPKP